MIKVTPFIPLDIKSFIPASVFDGEDLETDAQPFGITLMKDRTAIGCFLGQKLNSSTIHLFASFSEDFYENSISYSKILKKELIKFEKEFKIRRMQMYIKDTTVLVDWAHFLGFEIEGEMPGFGVNGESYLLVGKVVAHV